MPKRKKLMIDEYIGLPDNPDRLTVQKCRALMSLAESPLTLAEFKILDLYLSRINSEDPDKRTVVLERGELEKALGVEKINKSKLRERLKSLYVGVDIYDPDAPNGIDTVGLFERAKAVPDEEGLWEIRLKCTEDAMKYIFNIQNIGYIRYKLRNIINLTSRYSYIMFLYLENQRHLHLEWTVKIDDLKKILNCDGEKAYTDYYRFNDLVLKKCCTELNEKTECKYSYEATGKRGRKYTAVKFSLASSSVPGQVEGQVEGQASIFEIVPNAADEAMPEPRKDVTGYAWEVPGMGFTADEMAHIDELMKAFPDSRVPEGGSRDEAMRMFIQIQLAELRRRKRVKNRFAYFKKMIANDFKGTERPENSFHNYEERPTDIYKEVEKVIYNRQ